MKKIRPIKKEYVEVLKRIQDSIPKELLDNVTKKVMLAPLNAKMIRALANGESSPDVDMSKITPRHIEQAKAIVDSGKIAELERMIDVEDKDITRKIEEYVDGEIEKAIKRGELPKGKKFRNINKQVKWKKQNNK